MSIWFGNWYDDWYDDSLYGSHIFQILTYSSLNIYKVDKCVNNCINANKTRRHCLFNLKIGMGIPLSVYFKTVGFFQILTYFSLNIYEYDKYVNNFTNASVVSGNCVTMWQKLSASI